MAQKKYVIGVDFGTLSGRAVLVDVTDGTVAAQREKAYPHAVMTSLPEGKPLPLGWALQDPADYLDVLESTIPYLLRSSLRSILRISFPPSLIDPSFTS